MSEAIQTRRLQLLTLPPEFLRASLAGDRLRAQELLGVILPEDWPDAPHVLRLRLDQLEEHPEWASWLTRAMVLGSEQRVIGVIGFHGPPGGDWLREVAPGGVEFGYTVYPEWRRQGFAREASEALIDWAVRTQGVGCFALSIQAENRASVALARRLGFAKVGTWYHEVRGAEDVYRLDVPVGAPRAG